MQDALHSRYKGNEEKGDLRTFPKGLINGDLYEHAQAMAELQLTKPTLSALDLTYQTIADRCDGDLSSSDVSTVFGRSIAGERLRWLMDARNVVDEIQEPAYDESCKAVYKCYQHESLIKQGIDLDARNAYTDEVYSSCRTIVDSIFTIMYSRTSTLEHIKNYDYGDDFLVNAKPEDGAFDLLLDVEAVWDVLFTHNDNPAEIHFYDMQPFDSYVYNDPNALTPYPLQDPHEQTREGRLPVTNGVTPTVPQEITDSYPPPTPAIPPSGIDQLPGEGGAVPISSSAPVAPTATPSALASQFQSQASTTISNVSCEEPSLQQEEPDDTLVLAEQENKQTATYNRKLELEDQIAIALGAKLTVEDEELLGVDNRGGDDSPISSLAQEEASAIVEDIIDLGGDSLEATKNKIKSCVEQFTEGDPAARWKILFKSITQPAEFTQCVFGHLCKELGDESGRGMYRIKICKELTRGYGISSNQPVKSVEEVIDEMLNVCTNLKDSGQLLEHNKTKDHMEDKMMRIKLGNKFAFGISVIFKWPRDATDPAMDKREASERLKYLQDIYLPVPDPDELTFVNKRNQYLALQSPTTAREWFEVNSSQLVTAFQSLENTNANLATMSGEVATINKRAAQSQLHQYARVVDAFQTFVEQNILLRDTANQYTYSINERRASTLKLFQASPGQ